MQPVTEVTMVDLPCDVVQGQEKAVRPLDQAGDQSVQTWYAWVKSLAVPVYIKVLFKVRLLEMSLACYFC